MAVIRRKRQYRVPKPVKVKVGFPDGTDSHVLTKAYSNNYGTDTIPPRPFMSNAFRRREMYRLISKYHGFLMRGTMTPEQVGELIGIGAQGIIMEEITVLRDPPNAQSTIDRKGSSNPLIDTGNMRQSVTYKVET